MTTRARSTTHTGFTLVELLVVLSIIVALISIASPIIGIAQRQAMRTATGAILAKADIALRSFRSDFGCYPYQLYYPAADPDGTFAASAFDNRLAYNIGTTIADPDLGYVRNDIAVAANVFAYNATINGWYTGYSEGAQPSPVTYRISDVVDSAHGTSDNEWKIRIAWQLNFMAQARIRAAVTAGALDLCGPAINDVGTVTSNKTGGKVVALASCQSRDRPGWAENYLQGEIEQRFRKGDTLLDTLGNPVIYISRNVHGVQSGIPRVVGASMRSFDPRIYGLGNQGFSGDEGPGPQLITDNRCLLLYSGRVTLSTTNAGDGRATPTHTTYFPDQSRLIASDVRYYCAPGMEKEFELWSAGRDGRFGYMRNASVNLDNIPALPSYQRGLQ